MLFTVFIYRIQTEQSPSLYVLGHSIILMLHLKGVTVINMNKVSQFLLACQHGSLPTLQDYLYTEWELTHLSASAQ